MRLRTGRTLGGSAEWYVSGSTDPSGFKFQNTMASPGLHLSARSILVKKVSPPTLGVLRYVITVTMRFPPFSKFSGGSSFGSK